MVEICQKDPEASLKGLPLSKCDNINIKINMTTWRFTCGPVVRTPCFHYRRAGFESCSATCCLCAVMHMWVINKCHVPGTMPGGWVSEKNKAWHYRSKGLHRQCHVVEIRKEGLKITYSFFFFIIPFLLPFSLPPLSLSHTHMLFKKKSKAIITRK